MAIKIYNPATKTFGGLTTGTSELPLTEVLLLNILIEMQVQSTYLRDISGLIDEPSTLRTDIVSET